MVFYNPWWLISTDTMYSLLLYLADRYGFWSQGKVVFSFSALGAIYRSISFWRFRDVYSKFLLSVWQKKFEASFAGIF